MKKTLLTISILSFSVLGNAQTEYTNRAEFLKAVPQMIEGVQVVSPSEMTIKDTAATKKQMQSQGYIESDTPNPHGLMSVKERAPSAKLNKDADPNDYYLKKDLSEVKLSFVYKEVADPAKRIGFAPVGKHLAQGWTGIREFFEDPELGVCSLTSFHIKDTQMGIRINSDLVSYVVNNHPTTIEVEGSKKSGFIYTVSWVDNTFSKDFECAKMTFDKDLTKKMISLANNM